MQGILLKNISTDIIKNMNGIFELPPAAARLCCTAMASLCMMASCSKSSSGGGQGEEAPDSLEGKTFSGIMYVDYKVGYGFEEEARNYVFQAERVDFEEIEYEDVNGPHTAKPVTGKYIFEKTASRTGSLRMETDFVEYKLNLIFNGSHVTAEGTLREKMDVLNLPAKGTFIMK